MNLTLFDLESAPSKKREPEDLEWQREWQNMPEFVQRKQEAYATLVVRFRCQADLEDFAQRLGQAVNQKTKSIWHPYKSHWGGPGTDMRYVDEP